MLTTQSLALLVIGLLLLGLFAVIIWQQRTSITLQKVQLKQQFHSDQITIASLLGDEGLTVLSSHTHKEDLSASQKYGMGLLVQRCLLAYHLRPAFSLEEWETVVKDIKSTLSAPTVRQQWDEMKRWYTKREVAFVERLLGTA